MLRVPHFTHVTFTMFSIWRGRLVSLPEKLILSKFTCCEYVQITSLLNDTAFCMGSVLNFYWPLRATKWTASNWYHYSYTENSSWNRYWLTNPYGIFISYGILHIDGILPKGPYLPCVSMAGRALLAGYHRYMKSVTPIRRCIGITVVLY